MVESGCNRSMDAFSPSLCDNPQNIWPRSIRASSIAEQRSDLMENAAQANPTAPQKASRRATILSLGSSILINGAFPVIIYWALKNYTAASDYVALVLTGVPSLIDSIV